MERYEKYTSSRLIGTQPDWLGDIPSHWQVKQIKHLLQSGKEGIKIGPFGSALKLDFIKDSGYKVYGQENIIKDDFQLGYKYIDDDKYKELANYKLESGDIVVTMMGTTGKAKIVPENIEVGIMDSHLTRIRIDSKLLIPRLLELLINNSYLIASQVKFQSKGAIMDGLNSTIIKSLFIPIPPVQEQIEIVHHLNQKTSELDTLITKKEKLIELLKEERTATINQAVTKGLDPYEEMKNSGVEWLGEIPAHWVVMSFRFCIDVLTDYTANGSFASLATNVNYLESGFSRLVRLTDLRVNLENEGIYVDESAHAFLKKSELFGGEMLIANVGAYAGLVKIMPKMTGKYTLGPNMFLLRLNQNVDFFFYQLNSSFCAEQLKMKSISSAQPKLNKDDIRELKVTVPPLGEQGKILEYILIQEERINTIISKTEQEIILLKEYKTALISEVVTGKLKVM